MRIKFILGKKEEETSFNQNFAVNLQTYLK